MRYKPDHKLESRRKIVKAVGQGFRRHGFAGVGVDSLAKAAGVTSGAFYSHFASKDEAFDAAVAAGLDEVIEGIPGFQREHGARWVEAFVDYYMGPAHRADLACGCAMATLTPEVARGGVQTQAVYAERLVRVRDAVAAGLQGGSVESRQDRALATIATLLGGLSLARAVGATQADEVARVIRAAALSAAGAAAGVVDSDESPGTPHGEG